MRAFHPIAAAFSVIRSSGVGGRLLARVLRRTQGGSSDRGGRPGALCAEAPIATVVERLEQEKAFLLDLVRGIETEFIATGDGLARLTKRLAEIQRPCEELADVTVGAGHDSALQFAFQLLKKAEDLVLASYEQYDHVFATFGELEQRLEEIGRQQDDLMRVLLPLRFITMSFRIEAARHPEEVREAFFTLGETVDRTVAEVRDTMERQFVDIGASARIARTVVEQIAESVRRHRQDVSKTLGTSRDQLRALSDALGSSGSGASGLLELNRSSRHHIGALVMAQQCQDIARQQIEHVGAAIDEIKKHLEEAGPAGTLPDSEARHFVHKAGQLQSHHVANVFAQLEGAARDIKTGMESLRAEAAEAGEAAVRVGGSALDETVAAQCHAGIGELLSILRQAVQKTASILEAFRPLQASFVDCTGKATALAADVGYAGLNAQIFAVHAPNGGTLEVLAGRVRGVSEEVIEHVARMGAALNHTTQLVENLRQRLEDFQVLATTEEAVLEQESNDTRGKLAGLKERIPSLIARVSEEQRTFARDVETILGEVRFPEVVAAASARSLPFFRELASWGGVTDEAIAVGATSKIESLRSNYTMHAERVAHDAALAATSVAPLGAGDAAAFGDVELFDATPPSDEEVAAPMVAGADQARAPEETRSQSARADLGDNVELF